MEQDRCLKSSEVILINSHSNRSVPARLSAELICVLRCVQHGTVVSLVIPRPGPEGGINPPGVGKVLIEYSDIAGAVKAHEALHGCLFAGHTVTGTFLSEELYHAGQFD